MSCLDNIGNGKSAKSYLADDPKIDEFTCFSLFLLFWILFYSRTKADDSQFLFRFILLII